MKARLLIAGALLLAPGAVAQTAAAKLIGTWSCTADFDYAVKTWLTEYFDGGRMVRIDQDPTLRMVIRDSDGPAPGEMPPGSAAAPNERSTEGEWRIRNDGKLVEQLKRVIGLSILINGQRLSISPQGDLEVDWIDAQEQVSSLSFNSDGSFVATASDGIVTTCTRQKG